MRTTFSIQFFCRPSKTNKQGEAPIELSIVINGKRTYLQLPYKCQPKVFNQKRRPEDLEVYIAAQRTTINSILAEMANNGEPLTAFKLKEYLRNGGCKSYTVKELFEDFLAIQKQRVGKTLSKGVYKKYVFVADLFLKDFNPNQECSAITNNIVRLFFAKLDKTYQNATACGYKTRFKSFIRFGLDNDRIKINPLQGIKIIRERKQIQFLTDQEIEILITTPIDNDCLSRVRDCAVFQISSGLSYCDCIGLVPNDLQEKNGTYYIAKNRHKTGTPFFAVILPYGVAVFKKWNGNLPFISNQKYNLFLKALALQCGIEKNLHSHLFRHTYCTLLLNRGVSIKTVSRCAGHSTSKMTEYFYAFLKEETIIEEVSNAVLKGDFGCLIP